MTSDLRDLLTEVADDAGPAREPRDLWRRGRRRRRTRQVGATAAAAGTAAAIVLGVGTLTDETTRTDPPPPAATLPAQIAVPGDDVRTVTEGEPVGVLAALGSARREDPWAYTAEGEIVRLDLPVLTEAFLGGYSSQPDIASDGSLVTWYQYDRPTRTVAILAWDPTTGDVSSVDLGRRGSGQIVEASDGTVAFTRLASPGGVTAEDGMTLSLWDPPSGEVRELQGPDGPVQLAEPGAALDPTIGWAGDDLVYQDTWGALWRQSPDSTERERLDAGFTMPYTGIDVSPDGTRAIGLEQSADGSQRMLVVDLDGDGARRVPTAALPNDQHELLGWTDDEGFAVALSSRIVRIDVVTGARTVLSEVDPSLRNLFPLVVAEDALQAGADDES